MLEKKKVIQYRIWLYTCFSFDYRYMAICHPFLVERSRKPSASVYLHRRSVHQTTPSKFHHKDSVDSMGLISDTAQKCHWLRKLGACFKSSRSGGSGMPLKKRTCHYLLPVIIFSIALNIPMFLEFETFIIP